MCNADLTVYSQYWVKDLGVSFLDFNTKHKCKDYDAISTWIDEHEVFDPSASLWEGDIMLETTP